MKKVLFTLILIAVLAYPAMGVQHQVSFVDEFGEPVTTITSITVFNSGLGTSPTIYADRASNITVTNPITTSSTNSTFDQSLGLVRWFQTKPTYKLTVTDGSKTLTIDAQDEGDTRFPWYDNYIGTAASLSVGDNESITVGTDSDMVLAWNNGSNFISWIPASDGSAFNLGTSGTAKNVDFNWFVGTALGIKANEGAATLVIDGVTTSINASSNFATNINTGTSTGAITIGSATSGTLAFDTTSGITMNADDSIAVTTSAGTIGLGATGGDITIDGVDSSVIIRGTEAIADAVWVDADAGGIDITSAATFDIDVTATGGKILMNATEDAAGAISATVNGGTSETIVLTNTQGTGEDAFNIDATAGGIDIDFATAKNMAVTGGQFIYTSNEDVAGAFTVTTNTGTSETIVVTNSQGTDVASINAVSTAGGITLNAAKPVVITNAFEPDIVLVPDGAAYDVLANNSGQVHLIPDQTADITLDLPAEADGMYYKFVYIGGAEDAQDWLIDSENDTNYYIGGVTTHDDDDGDTVVIYSDGNSNSILGVLTPNAGTIIEIWCDGTNWRVTGTVVSGTDTSVTFADQ